MVITIIMTTVITNLGNCFFLIFYISRYVYYFHSVFQGTRNCVGYISCAYKQNLREKRKTGKKKNRKKERIR